MSPSLMDLIEEWVIHDLQMCKAPSWLLIDNEYYRTKQSHGGSIDLKHPSSRNVVNIVHTNEDDYVVVAYVDDTRIQQVVTLDYSDPKFFQVLKSFIIKGKLPGDLIGVAEARV